MGLFVVNALTSMLGPELIARLGLDTAKFERGMKSAQSTLKKFQGFASKVFAPLAAVASAAGLVTLAKRGIEAGSAITDLAEQTRTGVEEIQVLNFAAQKAGQNQEIMARALRNVESRLVQAEKGTVGYAEAVKALGLDASALLALPQERRLEQIGKAYEGATDKSKAYEAVQRLLGDEAGPKLLGVLKELATNGFDAVADAADRAGAVIEKSLADDLDNAADNLAQFETWLINWGGRIVGIFLKTFGQTKKAKLLEGFREQAREELGIGKIRSSLAFGKNYNAVEQRANELYDAYMDRLEKEAEQQRELELASRETYNAERRANEEKKRLARESQSLTSKISDTMSGIAKAISIAKDRLTQDDPAKRSLREIASISPFAVGATIQAGLQGEQARKALKLQQDAEELRKIGNVEGAKELMGKADALKLSLFKEGALSSQELSSGQLDKIASEGSDVARMRQELERQSVMLEKLSSLPEIEKAVKAGSAYK